MNLTTIGSADRNEARRAFLEYREAFRQEHRAIDGELMRAYRALSQGAQLIRLTETITAGGVDEVGRPKLAFARADERAIRYETWSHREGGFEFCPDGRVRAADRVRIFPAGTLPGIQRAWDFEAIAPLIPPRFRPPIAIENYHLLWEAEWSPIRRPRAPKDPALLRHLGGDLYAVVAVWDLTDLERAVLEMRG